MALLLNSWFSYLTFDVRIRAINWSANPAEGAGEFLGAVVRWIVDALSWFFASLTGASAAFIEGFSRALGVNSSLLSIVAVLIGLYLLYRGVRSLMARRFIAGVIWLLLGLWLLSALIS